MFQFIGLIIALVFLQVSSVFAEDDACSHWAAKITSMQGVVEIRKHTTQEWVPAKLNDSLCASDSLRTAPHSRATVQIQEETFMVLKERSTVRFSSIQENTQGIFSELLNLFNGEAYLRSRRPRELGIETPFVNAMHEGTEFLVKVNQDSTQVVVFNGVVVASNTLGQVRVSEGESALTMKGQAPVIGPRIELRDAVQWTLYFPPVIDFTSTRQKPLYSTLKPVLDRFQANDLAGAFEQLASISEAERNAEYHLLYASLLLTVGQVEQAQQHLDQVSQETQKNANVLALRSIIALAKNDQHQAIKLAEQAQQISPQTAAPKIALSYAYQSLFDIDKALTSAIEAAEADPDNGLAWARVSEMELATSNVDASMEAASKAQALNPQLAKTNTVLGFARLASLDLSEAEQSFRTAIKRDPSDPLARLGLGLAKIRQGHIKSGTKEMETAANLDPDNALIRSYLGKAYYEQRRGDIASTEYAIAKELDPKDPTPWFYDAIYKQTVNRPVEALHDMQKAIELNDNRAVFRSKLLLDEDLAARSASLGRIYNDLGFQQLGLVEGWKAVNTDPRNYSAHRLLADNYAALPRHEIARVSELLQAQLLQPINVTPVQPQLAESNLLILDGLGTQSSSFNEFNPLFARNRLAVQASGIYGGNNTWGDEVTHSGLWNRFSYSLGQYHFETDGFRENNDLKQDIYNVFTQFAVTPELNIQAEYRHKESKFGDLKLSFDPDNFNRNKRTNIKTTNARVGLRYKINPNSDLLASIAYQDGKEKILEDLSVEKETLIFDDSTDVDGYNIELQNLSRIGFINSVFGVGHFQQKGKFNGRETFTDFEDAGKIKTEPSFSKLNNSYSNIYFYPSFQLMRNLVLTLGVSFDHFEESFKNNKINTTQINPKIGLRWNPSNDTTIRASAFRVLKRPLLGNQTIEPTQVAGFNQFFDDVNGTISKRYAFGLDQKFSRSLYGGFEFSLRELKPPFKGEFREQLHRAYVSWTPFEMLAFSASYNYERFKRNILVDRGAGPNKLITHKIPLKMKIFSDKGIFWFLKANYVIQDVDFLNNKESDDFWIVDTELGYRLPKRLGIISFSVKNVFNKRPSFQGRNFLAEIPKAPEFQFDRALYVQLTLAF